MANTHSFKLRKMREIVKLTAHYIKFTLHVFRTDSNFDSLIALEAYLAKNHLKKGKLNRQQFLEKLDFFIATYNQRKELLSYESGSFTADHRKAELSALVDVFSEAYQIYSEIKLKNISKEDVAKDIPVFASAFMLSYPHHELFRKFQKGLILRTNSVPFIDFFQAVKNSDPLIEKERTIFPESTATSSCFEKFRSVTPINEHTWASLCKKAIQNGNCLKLASHHSEVKAKWEILLLSLRDSYEKNKTESAVDYQRSATALLIFLGELCFLKKNKTAKLIHDFLKLAVGVGLNQETTKLTIEHMGMLMGASLLEGLELSGKIVVDLTDIKNLKNQALEAEFFKNVIAKLLTNKIFLEEFKEDHYLNYSQPSQKSDLNEQVLLLQKFLNELKIKEQSPCRILEASDSREMKTDPKTEESKSRKNGSFLNRFRASKTADDLTEIAKERKDTSPRTDKKLRIPVTQTIPVRFSTPEKQRHIRPATPRRHSERLEGDTPVHKSSATNNFSRVKGRAS